MSNSSSMSQHSIITHSLRADEIVLGNITVNKIYRAICENMDVDALITAGCLNSIIDKVTDLTKAIDPSGTLLRDLAIISQSLVDPYFYFDNEWNIKNWAFSENKVYALGGYEDNYLTIKNDRLLRNGRYLICLVIESMPSGKLELEVNGNWVTTYSKPGVYYTDFNINNFATDKISFVAKGVSAVDNISIFSCSVHYISDRFYSFLIKKIKELAVIDAEGFVPRDEFTHTTDSLIKQFQTITGSYLNELKSHIESINPHDITPSIIGAAPAIHTHDQYLTENQLEAVVSEQMSNYAKLNHEHEQYLTVNDASTVITSIISEYLSEFISIKSMIITDGPTSKLPNRFAQTEISDSAMLLLPSTIYHNDYTSFDTIYGNITTNKTELINEAPKVFAKAIKDYCKSDQLAYIPTDGTLKDLNFRIQYHYPRKVKGYRIYLKDATLASWEVYGGDSTFIHTVTEVPEFKMQPNNVSYYEIFFETEMNIPSLSFTLGEILPTDGVDTFGLYIEIMYSDFDTNSFGIVKDEFSCCVPISGTNRIIRHMEELNHIQISPEFNVPNLPLYVFMRQNLNEASPTFITSYFPIEAGNTRKGYPLLMDTYKNISAEFENGKEYYDHPAFGKLILKEGASSEDTELKNLYDTSIVGWCSDGNDNTIVIEQYFKSKNVVMSAYMLSWRNENKDYIPASWSLIVDGRRSDGRPITIVYDSIEDYYPFYSVEDDDIVYYKKFREAIHVDKITLSMKNRTDGVGIKLNKLVFYIGERFYSIPQNKLFLGLNESAETCIGSATYHDEIQGYSTENIYFGTSCVIPVNNLEKTHMGGTYTVPNPYFTKDVVVSTLSHSLTQDEPSFPQIYITNVNEKEITLYTETCFRHSVSISRSW